MSAKKSTAEKKAVVFERVAPEEQLTSKPTPITGSAPGGEESPAPKQKKTKKAKEPKAEKPPKAPKPRDSRLPPAGTVLEKRDRDGKVRCKLTVGETTFRFKSKEYSSLTAAAMAACEDLGLNVKAINGFVFWGLEKPPRAQGNPVELLGKAWERYYDRAMVADLTDEQRKEMVPALRAHAKLLEKAIAKMDK